MSSFVHVCCFFYWTVYNGASCSLMHGLNASLGSGFFLSFSGAILCIYRDFLSAASLRTLVSGETCIMSDFKGEPFCHFFFWWSAECFRQLLKKWYTPPFSKAWGVGFFCSELMYFASLSTDMILLKQSMSKQHFCPIYLKGLALHCINVTKAEKKVNMWQRLTR